MQKGVSIKKNYIYNAIYQIINVLTPLLTTPYVSRVLSVDGIGKASFATSLITYFVIFASLGFLLYGQREIAKNIGNKEEQTKVFWEINILRTLFVSFALMINISLLISGVYEQKTSLMWILCLNIFAVMIDISFLYQGNEHFGKISIINIITKLLMVASIFLFVKTSSDVWVYVLINTLCLVFPNAMLWLFLNGYITKVKLNSLSVFVHIKGVFVLFIPTVSLVLYAMIDKSLIGFITNSDVQNGFYEQAEKIFRFALTIITCMAVVMVARNAKYFAQNRVDDIKQNIYKSSHFVWVLSIPMCLGMVCVAPNFIPWFLGEDFIGSNSILQVLSTLFVLMGLSNVLGAQYMLPTMKDKKYTIVILCGATLNIMLNIPLIYLWGALGASIATVVSELIVCVVMFCLVRKELSLKEMFKTIWKPLLSGIMMFGVIFPLSMLLSPSILNTFIIVFVGIAVYALMILALKDDLVLSLIKQVFAKVFKRNRK